MRDSECQLLNYGDTPLLVDNMAIGRIESFPGQSGNCWRYHSIVCFNPSSNPIRARNPNSRSALEVSRRLRGWPSGWETSHTRLPLNPVSAATFSARSLIEISKPAPRLTGSDL